jgi:pimeloyl-ACP methyl ester carboxylesterase
MPAPLAIAHGTEDAILAGAYFSEIPLRNLWRDGVQLLRGAGHAAHWEEPGAFDALLSEFAQERVRAVPA